jgi:hypothetical protein
VLIAERDTPSGGVFGMLLAHWAERGQSMQ